MFAAYSNCLPIATTCSPDCRFFQMPGWSVSSQPGFLLAGDLQIILPAT